MHVFVCMYDVNASAFLCIYVSMCVSTVYDIDVYVCICVCKCKYVHGIYVCIRIIYVLHVYGHDT